MAGKQCVLDAMNVDRFTVNATPLAGCAILGRLPIGDDRGYFERLFCETELMALLSGRRIVQINHSFTPAKGTVRGMHFQKPPDAEKKIISCLRGEVWDVAVDVRFGSPTFLQWHAEVLSADNLRSMYIPEGFAHGFQTLTDDCALLYFHTAPHSLSKEGALNVQDPRLGITWPMPISGLSPRDAKHPYIADDFAGISL
jgi:dTDP-4-dehydrorhamnose 3,5-epimerase